MSAFNVTGWISSFYQGRYADSCASQIFYGGSRQQATDAFKAWVLGAEPTANPNAPQIKKIVCAPLFDQLFTETGPVPLDWPRISEAAEKMVERTQPDEAAEGYWVDCDQVVNPARLSASLDSLRRELPEEVRSGLNWSADKLYFFIVSVLSPPQPVADPYDEVLEVRQSAEPGTDDIVGAEAETTAEEVPPFPEIAESELAVLVHARNSVIAAWLWRKSASSGPLAANQIRIDPWCGARTLDREC